MVSRVAAVAGTHSSAASRTSPAARSVASWLCSGEKSTIDDECPACGGSTSVGTTSAARSAGAVTSRSTAIGVLNLIPAGRCHRGGRRSSTVLHQRRPVVATANGEARRARTSDQNPPTVRVATAAASAPTARL